MAGNHTSYKEWGPICRPKKAETFRLTGEHTPRVIRVQVAAKVGFPGGSNSEESAYNVGDLGSILGLRRSPENRMATLSSILAWRIPWTEESSGLSINYMIRNVHFLVYLI